MIIKNGRVIDPKSGFDGIADIIIKDGKIKKILKNCVDKVYEKCYYN